MPANEEYLRSPKLMHRVFCGSALLLLLTTIWMMWADYNDEWRTYQRKAFHYQAERLKARETTLTADKQHEAKVKELEQKKVDATKQTADQLAALAELHSKFEEIDKDKDGKISYEDIPEEFKVGEKAQKFRDLLKGDFDRLASMNPGSSEKLLLTLTEFPTESQRKKAVQVARDLVALAKPRLSSLVLFTTEVARKKIVSKMPRSMGINCAVKLNSLSSSPEFFRTSGTWRWSRIEYAEKFSVTSQKLVLSEAFRPAPLTPLLESHTIPASRTKAPASTKGRMAKLAAVG